MKTQRLLLLVILPALLLFSCTIEKRVYLPGYHIQSSRHGTGPKKQRSDQREQRLSGRPDTEAQAVLPRREPVLTTAAELPLPSPVPAAETLPAEEEKPAVVAGSPEIAAVTPEPKAHRTALPGIRLPGSEKQMQQQAERSAIGQADSHARAGLLLAPLKFIFTLLLITLVIAGVVLLFVLESAMGGTVLLAAGAVLLILTLL